MKETKVSVNREEKYIEFQTTVNVPFQNKQRSEFDIEEARKRSQAYAIDLLGSFSERLAQSIIRRMQACVTNLMNHIADVEYCDECGHIVYVRKDKTRGTFNVPSYSVMMDAVKALRMSQWKAFLNNRMMVDQAIKALLNDPEQDHSDEGSFRFSELVSLLCECHANGGGNF